jgi:hypothetical protein
LVTIVFGLFTDYGGRLAAVVSLVAGLASYLAGVYAGFDYPYLFSLGVALLSYLVVARYEPRGRIAASAAPTS